MAIEEFAFELREREREWKTYGLHADYLAEHVLDQLLGKSPAEYALFELLTTEAVASVLQVGVATINANRRGARMMSFGSGGSSVGSLADGLKFEELFEAWAAAGWIDFQSNTGRGEAVASLVSAVSLTHRSSGRL